MAKRLICLLVALTLLSLSLPCSYGEEERTLVLVITSDLHFTLRQGVSIMPLIDRSEDLANTLADEVIALHPDAFVLCGDNTNSGRQNDAEALSAILQRIRESGVPVLVVPGNHDFDVGTAEEFFAQYGALCEPEERDAASLSFMLRIPPLRLLLMDDSSYMPGSGGKLREETMDWLEKQLSSARENGETVLFFSHHNVLPGGESAVQNAYMIQNPKLRDLLLSNGVRLCLSGHRHSQEVLSHGEMYEIISAAPAASPHLLGVLTLEGGTMRYEARPIGFSAFGAGYGLGDLPESERFQEEHYRAMLCESSSFPHYDEATQNRVLALFQRFLTCYGNGALLEVREEILSDPAYEAFRDVFSTTNYGLWMEALLHSDALPGNRLELSISRD